MAIEMIFATLRWKGWMNSLQTWSSNASGEVGVTHVIVGKPIMEAYQNGYERTAPDSILGFCHDDVLVYEKGWDKRVMAEFNDPQVGMVGFGGGIGFGSPDLYVSEYKLANLGRWRFRSNLRNAEQHGERFVGQCDVACLDGFAMFVRREIVERWGGWPLGTPVGYFVYDMALSAEVRKQGYRTRLVGVDCEHISGQSASITHLSDDHAAAHRWLYENYKGTIPFAVE